MITYDKLLKKLKEEGYTTYKIKKTGIIGGGTLSNLIAGKGGLDSKTINRLCKLLDCQPGDLMEYVADDDKK